MSGPRNRTTDLSAAMFRLLNEPDAFVSGRIRDGLAPGFRRLDRRKIGAMPDADVDAFIDSHLALAGLVGSAPTFHMEGVIAVRGERLALTRTRIVVGEAGELEEIVLTKMDEPVERAELIMLFDTDDVDLALTELDRLHDELAHD